MRNYLDRHFKNGKLTSKTKHQVSAISCHHCHRNAFLKLTARLGTYKYIVEKKKKDIIEK